MDPVNPLVPGVGDYAFIGAMFALYAALILIWLAIAVASYVVMSLALSSFFAKVGVERWIAWVPIYRTWRWLEVGGQPGWISLLVIAPSAGVVTSVFTYIGMYRSQLAFQKQPAFLLLGIFLPFVWLFLLGGRNETYRPDLITAAGYPPPLAGFGAARAS
jgi:hypothetical protein